jgi:hypothetical protein
MASEDSDQLVSGFLAIHRLSYFRDLNQSFSRKMPTNRDELYHHCELLEVALLGSAERVPPKVRDDHVHQISPPANDIPIEMFSVIVVPLVREYLADAEVLAELVQSVDAALALRNRELMSDLIASLVAASANSAWLADKTD